jgi:ATP-dependent RNA helicase RhlE
MSFDTLGLAEPLLRAVHEYGYTTPTPIQAQAIPAVLSGGDVMGGAQTGTGKTAGFVLPMLHRLMAKPAVRDAKGKLPIRALILTPTRELAAQVEESVRTYGKHSKLSSMVMFGGVGMQPQIDKLRRGVDILVATPGRLLDHHQQRTLDLSHVEIFVLDEADRMLDMGFIHDIKRVVAMLRKERQTLFFSATMPQEITRLADSMLIEPVRVAVTPQATTVERIAQRVIHTEKSAKPSLLVEVLKAEKTDRVLVFTRTKHGADKVVRSLEKTGFFAEAIHGNKSQNQRERVLADFRSGKLRILIATDIAARGIDVDGVSHVINYDLPNVPESYVHRIGRTARAGAEGIAISFCDQEEGVFLRDIERLIRVAIPASGERQPHRPAVQGARGGRGNGGGGGRNNQRGNGAPRLRRGSQTTSELLHSSSAQASRDVTPATAHADIGRETGWRRKNCWNSTAPSLKCCRTAIFG